MARDDASGFVDRNLCAGRTRIRRRQRSCCARPWNLRPSKAVLRARRMQLLAVHHEGLVRIDQHQVGGRAFGQRAGGQAEDARRRRRSARASTCARLAWPSCTRRQRGGQQRLQPHRAGGGGGKRLALGVGALRLMAGNDHVDHARWPRLPPSRRGRLRCAAAATPCGRCNRRRHPVRSAPGDGPTTPQVMGRPRALAAAMASSAARVEIWPKCSRAPVSSTRRMSRSTISTSAMAGAAGRPSRVANSPSVAAAPFTSSGSSAWPITSASKVAA